ncbi:MAG: hypothetical protein LBQ66_00635 [Planctomycetaceae bacterium]|nr:hypothetical protein [Planctomycetaceae bacterium]
MSATPADDGLMYQRVFPPSLSASTPTRKVDNRPLGGCVFGERSKPKTVGRNTHRQNQNAQNIERVGFANAVSAPVVGEYADATARRSVAHLTLPYNVFRPRCRRVRRRNRLAVGCPPYVTGALWHPRCRRVRRRNRPAVGCLPYVTGALWRSRCRRVRRRNRPAVGCLPYVTNAFHAPFRR